MEGIGFRLNLLEVTKLPGVRLQKELRVSVGILFSRGLRVGCVGLTTATRIHRACKAKGSCSDLGTVDWIYGHFGDV